MAQLLHACGLDWGAEGQLADRSERKGREWKPALDLVAEITDWLVGSQNAFYDAADLVRIPNGPGVKEATERFRYRILGLDWPALVKVPGMHVAGPVVWPVLKEARRLHEVVLCVRPLRDIADARMAQVAEAHKTPGMRIGERAPDLRETFTALALIQSLLLDHLETWRIPYRIAPYPAVAQEWVVALQAVRHVWPGYIEQQEVKDAWRKTARADLVGYSTGGKEAYR